MSQQKDSDPEEYKRLHSEKEAHVKRIQQLTEESTKLKAEFARLGFIDLTADSDGSPFFHQSYIIFSLFVFSLCRTNNTMTSFQSQIQSLRDNMNKIIDERNTLKKEVETKTQELQEKTSTITQVKKIGRRYKTQYDELKAEHEKVSA